MKRIMRRTARCLSIILAAACFMGAAAFAPLTAQTKQGELMARAFPGAEGWAAQTLGGRGGRIVRVTTLAATGPGSFAEAVAASGPRIVVFEVGGVIDLNTHIIEIKEPYLTIAGQTAPSPGITFIRGGMLVGAQD